MEVQWFGIDQLEKRRALAKLRCKDDAALSELLDDIFNRTEEFVDVRNNGHKPTIVLLPIIEEVKKWDDKDKVIKIKSIGGVCDIYQKRIKIAIGDNMGRAIIHEFIHWLKPNLPELDVKLTEGTLVRYYKWVIASGNLTNQGGK